MKEARCKICGAVYQFECEKIPKIVTCVCESTNFEILAEATA